MVVRRRGGYNRGIGEPAPDRPTRRMMDAMLARRHDLDSPPPRHSLFARVLLNSMAAKGRNGRPPVANVGQREISGVAYRSLIEQIAHQILVRARDLPANGSVTWRAIQEWHPSTRTEADAAIAYAMDAGWLVESAGALCLTQTGIEFSRRRPPSFRKRRKS